MAEPRQNDDPILVAGDTCWRIEAADKVAFLVDGAAFYDALVKVMRRATRSILVLGWDADPWVPLRPGGKWNEDKLRFGAFLTSLTEQQPHLQVKVLKWRTALPVALQYPSIPMPLIDWASTDAVRWKADGHHPPGATHHQKVIVVDDAVAFCGGLDVARDRFDTPRHLDNEPRRRTPTGWNAQPHHDVMIMVGGNAAAALGNLARERWRQATGERLDAVEEVTDRWPEDVQPAITNCAAGLSRTEPEWAGRCGVTEIEALYSRAIAQARDIIYIENQYLASAQVAAALVERLREADGPQVVLVLPEHSPSYFDKAVMDPVRDQAIGRLREAAPEGRLGIYAAYTAGGKPIINHSKVMICDDRIAIVGSANLNNRSLYLDTECAVSVEATGRNAAGRRTASAIGSLRRRLLADHLGITASEVAHAVTDGSKNNRVLLAIETLRRRTNRLRPLETHRSFAGTYERLALHHLLDPRHPEPLLGPGLALRQAVRQKPFATASVAGALGVAGLAWWLRRRG